MALPVWGNLQKSQIDDETIEEAIARLIQAHEDDPNAHVEVGESLQSHKAAAIIDHLIASIIADKIKDGEITIPKLTWDKFILQPSLESLDAWNVVTGGVGAGAEVRVGHSMITTGDAVGDISRIGIQGAVNVVHHDKNPWFQCIMDMAIWPAELDIRVICGLENPFDIVQHSFGFVWSKTDAKMYAWYYDGAEHSQEIVGYNATEPNTLKAELSDSGDTIKFYVNGVLKHTFSNAGCEVDSEWFFTFGGRNKTIDENPSAIITNIIFVQDW